MCGSARNVICKKQTVSFSLSSCIAICHYMTEDFNNFVVNFQEKYK